MLLVLFGLPAVVVLLALTLLLAGHARRRLRGGGGVRLASPKPWALVCGLAVAGAFLVFAYAEGAYSPGFYGDKTCMWRMGVRAHPSSYSYFPLSTVCSGGVEIVPGWVNPVLAGLGVLAVVACVALPVAAVVRWRRPVGDRAA
ncbi:hypothetical protein [Streptomyces pinistramenti]|uniref:hypothetical protein n=1 Tax=Streptomyces pinistramenti TaxID=2884812 RepID=UPI001D09275A|nr:hypothetical protein [Streptomyces pinistramenti]MCB5907875.1 hypothetical protein [Streptomyces pinistramenti]